jgi:ribonuclease HI
LDGTIIDYPDAKQSRTNDSDEKRGLVAALVGALEKLGVGSSALVCAPGTYIEDGVYHARDWKARGWRNSQNELVANPDIWERFLELVDDRDLDVTVRRWRENSCTELRKQLKDDARKACRDWGL